MEQNMDHNEYYAALHNAPIGETVRHYCPERITEENEHVLHLDCPNHTSTSKTSLHVNLDSNSWYCFGCGVGGDNLQFVEFIQIGSVTKNTPGSMPESHRMARDSLAQFLGLPPMATLGFSEEEYARYRSRLAEEQEVYQILTEYTEACHKELLARPAVLKWVKKKYGFDDEIITRLKIGFAPTEFTESGALMSKQPIDQNKLSAPSKEELVRVGAAIQGEDYILPLFRGRIVFPYWHRGQVKYMIARKTPWTPKNGHEKAKYKKLMVHSNDHSYVSKVILNNILYNEECLPRAKVIIITEGITDAISLQQHEFDVISPVTVRFKKEDMERLIPKLKNKTVYICMDNEWSRVGEKAAIEAARVFHAAGIEVRIINLPLGPKQQEARRQLELPKSNL